MTAIKSGMERKSDEQVAILLISEDTSDMEAAAEELDRRFRPQLLAMMRSELQTSYVDDAIQETWKGFREAIRRDGYVKNARGLLRTIAKRRKIDVIRKRKAERQIELDLDPGEGTGDDVTQGFGAHPSFEDELLDTEERLRAEHLRGSLPYYAFTDAVLSDCQRIIWTLRVICGYPSKTVARLIGKKNGNIRVQVHKARRWIRAYYESEEFELARENEEMPHIWSPKSIPAQATLVEYFAEQAIPRLTPEELKPLGLTNEDIERGYNVSLMMPRMFDEVHGQTTTPPYLVLTRKSEWDEMERHFERLAADPEDLPNEFPEQAMIEVHVEKKDIILRVAPIHQMVPDDPDYPVYPDTYVSDHRHRVRVPVILAPYSHSLYTSELLARWPFVKAKDATGEGRDIYSVEDGQIVGRCGRGRGVHQRGDR